MRRNRAFTLIELLVVIAIIAAGQYLDAGPDQGQGPGTRRKFAVNMRTAGLGLMLYELDTDGYWPINFYPSGQTWWTTLLYTEHISTAEIVWCPGRKGSVGWPEMREYYAATYNIHLDSSTNHDTPCLLREWWRGTIGSFSGDTSWPSSWTTVEWSPNYSRPFRPDKCVEGSRGVEVFVVDTFYRDGWSWFGYDDWKAAAMDGSDPPGSMANSVAYVAHGGASWWSGLSLRHPGYRANALTFGGSVSSVGNVLFDYDRLDTNCIWDGY